MRDFWRSQGGLLAEFASRFSGSSDLYRSAGRRPTTSINFVTAHDGFTLADLVTYNTKHNDANGEANRDGADDPDRATDGTLLSDDDFLLLINAWWEPLGFRLPTTRPDQTWHVEIDAYDPPAAALPSETSPGDAITVQPRSILVLRAQQP